MIQTDRKLDAKGLACPMPVVKTKKAMQQLAPGHVLEVQATDKGSIADIKAWAQSVGHQYIGVHEEEGVITHYLRKTSSEETEEKRFPHVVSNEELQAVLAVEEDVQILDVRESAEYAFGHIPGALSAPLGALEELMRGLDQDASTYVICRTGNRSDMAAQKLADAGFSNVKNVVPGMSGWNGSIEKSRNE
ncbi:sulfurtransferase TusA family protein [Sporosarcina sp. Te-1]|uniref:sulfurtransferase TusA family protein n=1 Tax=Sporosarcina sp. Te-1 TaxID=2818390 RepID=UPI001A9DA0FD|nr:sulfurtransferase TusA family protein [Sporosarcina sp. Te-1]QTD40400.1 sulfurtransferase TusA family protein [Sporosarcina sp. Te-1]